MFHMQQSPITRLRHAYVYNGTFPGKL